MSIKVPFKVSARTAKLIGLENFSTEEGAIIELVKNTYDADAKNCVLIFDIKHINKTIKDENGNDVETMVLDKENSHICIIDNGIGMRSQTIENQWMTIGTDNKLYIHTTDAGRIKTGAKGIGRFALNRLGMFTNLLSMPNNIEKDEKLISNSGNIGFEWTVDWADFDKQGASVSDIEAVLDEKTGTDFRRDLIKKYTSHKKLIDTIGQINFSSGTIIEITQLNDEWNEDKLKKLFSNLELLLPPEEQNDFKIDFHVLHIPDEFGTVKRGYNDDFDYKITAVSDGEKLNVELTRNELDTDLLEKKYSEVFEFEPMKKHPFRLEDLKARTINLELPIDHLVSEEVDKGLLKKIGQFGFTFYYLKNNISDEKDEGDTRKYPYNNINSANRKSWLKKFGGIKIFRDGFRIRPYGEQGDDWLRLGERQAQSPGGAGQRLGGYRIRPNQIAGTIKISRIHNPGFSDKSSREGLIENDEFQLFKNLLKGIIGLFERDRNTIMFHLSELHKQRNKEEETLRKAKEEAERINRQKEEKEKQRDQSKKDNEDPNETVENEEPSSSEETLADGIKILEKENEKKDAEIRLLRSLASVGLIVSSFAHELHNLKTRLVPRSKFLKDELIKYLDESEFAKMSKYEDPFFMLDLIGQEDLRLQHWLTYSLNTLKRDKRERKDIGLNSYFEMFSSIWQNSLKGRKISLEIKKNPNEVYLRAFEIDLDCIFNNLLSNAINALKGYNDEEKKISITILVQNDIIEIDFSDNGKGLDKKYMNNPYEIFDLFESSKTDQHGNIIGTGLGLSIVRTIISEYTSSSINIIDSNKGLTFKVKFKLSK